MKNVSKKSPGSEAGSAPELRIVADTKEQVREGLYQLVISLGLEEVTSLVEEERTRLCGPRYQHDSERTAHRAGTASSELVLGGRRVSMQRPRVRTTDGREVVLSSWQEFADTDPLEERAMEQMLVGVPTRKYKRSLEPVSETLPSRGTSKSSVSRRFVKGTQKRLEELQSRDLSSLHLVSVMIDGVHVGEHVILVALGFDTAGHKYPLGIAEGATENSTSCKQLLSNLIDRGLPADQSLLFVIDGSKALRKAINDVFGKRGVVQRCQEHKMRNVTDQLPEDMRASTRAAMQDAYRTRDVKRAKQMLGNLQRTLASNHPGAAQSLAEGLDETLTVVGFQLSALLERTLSTTNPIENLIGRVRDTGRRVKRWRDGVMVMRWTAAGILEAETKFRRARGYKSLPRLVAQLKHNDQIIDSNLESQKQVA